MTPEEIDQKIDNLVRRTQDVNRKKAVLSGTLQEKKRQLAELVQEIREQGYDPRKLKENRDQLQEQLVKDMNAYEAELKEVETALAAYDVPEASRKTNT